MITGLISGIIASFLLTQPGVSRVVFGLMDYLYGYLPEPLSGFLTSQTLITMIFLWFMIFAGSLLWFVRGDFFRAERESADLEVVYPGDEDPGDDESDFNRV